MDFAIVQIPGESVYPFRSNPHSIPTFSYTKPRGSGNQHDALLLGESPGGPEAGSWQAKSVITRP
jgi:hypothetical protein